MRHSVLVNRAWSVLAALVGVAGEAVAIAASSAGSPRWNEAAVAAVVVAYAAVGLLILWHRPGHPIGRLSLAIAPVWGVGEAMVATSYSTLHHHPDSTPAALVMTFGSLLRALPWLVAALWIPLRFPDGESAGTRLSRVAERVSIAAIVATTLAGLTSSDVTDTRLPHVDNPIGLPHSTSFVGNFLATLFLLLGVTAIGLMVAVLVQRYRRGSALTRQQTLIFAAAFVPPVAALVASASDSADPWLFGVCTIPLPVAIGVTVLQRRLYDLPLAANRSLTYGALSIAIAGLYAVTVGGVGAMLSQQGAAWVPWLAAGVVAVSFAPLREGLQRSANRVIYGQWSQPGEVLTRTKERVSDARDLPALLGSLATELVDDLGLGYVEVTDRDGHRLASAGTPDGATDALPMTAYGEPAGTLRWTRRALRNSDRVLLEELADHLGAVAHAHGLLASVRAAQERLVLAREEERRRLRRDLHDGLGPTLAGLTLQVDTIRNRLATDPSVADADLVALRGTIQETVREVRSIVEGLRPAVLDDLGLAEAVRQLAGTTGSLSVEVDAGELTRLPAAVEVAAYRIVQEGLANATKHADARRLSVTLSAGSDALDVMVCDDGHGELRPRDGGVGLGSMRERAEEIGGTFEISASPGRGTTVRARLPLNGRSVR
jgi:signal transduction histidine kinase